MAVLKTLKRKGKNLVVGVALAGALWGAGCSKENTEEIKDNEAKMEQRTDSKSEIKNARKKLGYLDEYLAAIERGEDKDEAYRILTLKMADNNQKVAEEMQKQVDAIQKQTKIVHVSGAQLGVNAALLLFWLSSIKNTIKEKGDKVSQQLSSLLKSKGVKEPD